MNVVDAAKPVLYHWDHDDEDGWSYTSMQTADFGHRMSYRVVREVYRMA